MVTSTINISLPDTLKAEVEKVMESDGYGNTSEFFRDLARDYLKRRQRQKLEELLLEALDSDDFSPLTAADFDDIKKRGLERLSKIKK